MKSIADAMGGRNFGQDTPEPKGDDAGNPVHDHLRKMRDEQGGKHMHVQSKDEGGYASHQIGEDGEPEGPHDHENIDALKQHMDKFLDEEAEEYGGESDDEPEGLM